MAGSTRPQTVGRINQVADADGDEDQDKDKYEDEIPSYEVLLTTLVDRFGVSRMRVFFKSTFAPSPLGAIHIVA